MTDVPIITQSKRLNFTWTPEVIFRPRRAFQNIASHANAVWLTPLLILSVVVLINVLVVGRLKSQAAALGEITYPPDYQYWSAEQQAQYMQAMQSTQGPVFVYVLPAITSLLGVWFGWLILGGIVHLVTTLLGGRGSTAISMNVVAWASIPLAIREIIQIIYVLIAKKLISSPGLSGFSPVAESGFPVFVGKFLRYIDIYLVWEIILIIIGVYVSTKLSKGKAAFGVILSVLIILLLQSGLAYLLGSLGGLNITRPFFF